ncbi:hypothetical protein Hamer_G031958 [Homarus americanus]|uniref:Uncharacterized protein n=1 Tax=Homarus americanus TaxID=6706 RepID=A0A8J5MQJ9_HOMAM
MRQAFFTQLDTAQDVSQTLKRLTAATQESNKMVKDLSQAFTTHLEEYKQGDVSSSRLICTLLPIKHSLN